MLDFSTGNVAVTNKRAVDLLLKFMKDGPRPRGSAVHAPDERVASMALNYLSSYGYLREEISQWRDITIDDIVKALKQFQAMFGITKSGQVDVRTVRAMEAKRCGCPDIVREWQHGYKNLQAMSQTSLTRWTKTGLRYSIDACPHTIQMPDFERVVDKCFQDWAVLSNITITRGPSPADISVGIGKGPQSNFDGPGGVLAWAYLPDGSDHRLLMRFDDEENFTLTPNGVGILLANVACHEFGHLLGLDHSKLNTALMAPYYNPAIALPQTQDDIPRFTARYGTLTNPPVTPPTTPPTTPQSQLVVSLAPGSTVTLDGRRIV